MVSRRLDPASYTVTVGDVKRSFDGSALTYEDAAVLQARVCEQLIERLDLVAIEPRWIVDSGAGTGAAVTPLHRRFPSARIIALDIATGMLHEARRRGVDAELISGNSQCLPLADQSIDCVFSNLMLQWCPDIDAVFAEVRRVLKPGGLLVFSTFGPDTLQELRAAWAAADDYSHVNLFIDMHDVGDALIRAGLVEPVMDIDRFVLTYGEVTDVMRDLKAIGAHNVTAGRARGLTGRGRFRACTNHYEQFRRSGRIPATFEVIYGQAWAGEPRQPVGPDGSVQVPLDRIGRR